MPDDHEDLPTHLLTMLSVSAGMVGVCLTAIGMIGVVTSLKRIETVYDELLVADAFLFLSATLISFLGLRTRLKRRLRAVALAVDVTFSIGLALMVAVCALLVWFVV